MPILRSLRAGASAAGASVGLRCVTFAGGAAFDHGELRSSNLAAKFARMRFQGGTYIVPGFRALLQVYMQDFGALEPEARPLVLVAVLTDGEAADLAEFSQLMEQLPLGVYVAVGVVGAGEAHDRALASFLPVATLQPRMRIMRIGGDEVAAGADAAAHAADELDRMFRAPVSETRWITE